MESKASYIMSTDDIEFVNGFMDMLLIDIASGQDYAGLLPAMSQILTLFREQIDNPDTLDDPRSWTCIVPERNDLTLRITGPGTDDQFEIITNSTEEASNMFNYVSGLAAACTRLRDIYDRSLEILRKRKELERDQANLRQPADTTVNNHIQLLRRYNKTKDVGQQLIGLIAEDRGVSIRTLYHDGDYGVYPDD